VLVVVIDLLVCFIFVIFIFTQHAGINKDVALSDSKFVQITDFTVRIKHFPSQTIYKSQIELKALLILHI
jgi:hypothetical protein